MVLTNTLDDVAVVRRIRQLGLIENPFAPYQDSRYFVPCAEHVALYQAILRMSVEGTKKHIALIMGEPGTGKTTLARRLTNSVFDGGVVSMKSVLVSGEINTPTTLVRTINDSLGIPTRRKLEDRLTLLRKFVTNKSQTGSGLFLVIDANLDSAIFNTLLEIMQWTDISGFTLASRAVVFSSEDLFRYERSKPELKSMVSLRQTLGNLSYAGATNLVESRVRMAGRSAPLFQPDALTELVENTQGHPGRLIALANQAFVLLLESNDSSINLATVMEAERGTR